MSRREPPTSCDKVWLFVSLRGTVSTKRLPQISIYAYFFMLVSLFFSLSHQSNETTAQIPFSFLNIRKGDVRLFADCRSAYSL